jgi:hypothetical protein
MRSAPLYLAVLLVGAVGVACGGESTKPAVPATTASATVEAAPPPPPVPSAEPTAEPTAAPTSAPKSSGRTPVSKTDPSEITDTFGYSPAAILHIGDATFATLRIPENALRTATNVTFKLDAKARGLGGGIGKIYHAIAIVPPASSATPLDSNGPPFEVSFPYGKTKDANLAIGEVTGEPGKEKVKWRIIAQKRADDTYAYFELTGLGDQLFQLTSKPPAEAK